MGPARQSSAMTRIVRLRRLVAATLLLCIPAAPLGAATGGADAALERMVERAKAKRWVAARDAARSTGDPAALEAYEWLRLRQPGLDDFERGARWIEAHPGWPGQKRIQGHAERALETGQLPPARIAAFFDRFEAVTGHGAVVHAEALAALGRAGEATEVARRAWLELDLTAMDENRLTTRFAGALAPLQEKRLDNLIWRTRLTAARRHLRRVGAGQRALGAARIALLKNEGGVDRLVAAVPPALRGDAGLAYARMVWRQKRGLRARAEDMMLEASAAGRLGRAESWADERALFVREALDRGAHARAYALAAGHGLSEGKRFADMEWLAGWIALRKMNEPARAKAHFERLHAGVKTPVSKGRAAFWAGEAAAAAGDAGAAARWHAEGARHPSAFYGQLAIERVSGSGALPLPAKVAPVDGPCVRDPRVAVGTALARGGAIVPARRFFYDAAETCRSDGEVKALAEVAERIGAFRISVGLSRELRKRGTFMPEISHPIVRMPVQGCTNMAPPERALTLAIARQESGFDAKAGSGAGALGVMQVMPATGRRTAPHAGLRYSRARLGSERAYNAIIGQCYMSRMLDRFDGSFVLAIAAYNAGPRNVEKWIARNGDPRSASVSTLDWIERIPFHETRNYVQRVLEGVAIYRARLRT